MSKKQVIQSIKMADREIKAWQKFKNVCEIELKYESAWRCCYQCGVKRFGKLKKQDMRGITVSMGECPICGKKTTLIPYDDFLGCGD